MRLKILQLVIGGLLLFGCSQVFEDDIENEEVNILSPRSYSNANTIDVISASEYTFRWELVDGADDYRLQLDLVDSVANEAFYNNVWDSIVVGDRAPVNLSVALPQNGRYYRLAIRSQNSAYESGYSYVTFYRSTSVDISDREVVLLEPVKDDTVKTLKVVYTWTEFSGGDFDRYLFERLNSSGTVLSTDTVSSNSMTKTYIQNGVREYWRVRAQNDISTTKSQSPTWSFVVDTTTTN